MCALLDKVYVSLGKRVTELEEKTGHRDKFSHYVEMKQWGKRDLIMTLPVRPVNMEKSWKKCVHVLRTTRCHSVRFHLLRKAAWKTVLCKTKNPQFVCYCKEQRLP